MILFSFTSLPKVGPEECLVVERSPVGPEVRFTLYQRDLVVGITLSPQDVRALVEGLEKS